MKREYFGMLFIIISVALYFIADYFFGQELVSKYENMPKDICWHLIGHLQTNKVKYIAPFVHMVHSIDSLKLIAELNKEAKKVNRVIPFLFQIHIALEETKFGLSAIELDEILNNPEYQSFKHVKLEGLMGMATFTDKKEIIINEFASLKSIYDKYKITYDFKTLSMGMSSDFEIAIEQGSNMIRVGSRVFE